jgi:hypothetical protein
MAGEETPETVPFTFEIDTDDLHGLALLAETLGDAPRDIVGGALRLGLSILMAPDGIDSLGNPELSAWAARFRGDLLPDHVLPTDRPLTVEDIIGD